MWVYETRRKVTNCSGGTSDLAKFQDTDDFLIFIPIIVLFGKCLCDTAFLGTDISRHVINTISTLIFEHASLIKPGSQTSGEIMT